MWVKGLLHGMLGILIAIAWAMPSTAANKRSISGNVQAWIGNGLPIPWVNFIGVPGTPGGPTPGFGGARPVTTGGGGSGTCPSGAAPTTPGQGVGCAIGPVVAYMLTTGPAPQKIAMPAGQFQHDGPPIIIPLKFANPNIWQINANFTLSAPAPSVGGVPQTGSLSAGGRSGAPVVTFCPGYTATLPLNPGCLFPGGRTGYLPSIPKCSITSATPNGFKDCAGPKTPTFIPGLLRYQALKNQFGGTGRAHIGGSFSLALRPAATVAAFAGPAKPNPTGIGGGKFGSYNQGVPPVGKGVYVGVVASPLGKIISLGSKVGPGLQNISTGSFGGPLTTGKVTISQPLATPPEKFTITGSDNRTASGSGNITLVAGAVSKRSVTGPNANRTFVNYVVPEAAAAVSAGMALLSLTVCHRLARRRSR
jgi:hypothetical protein